MSTGFLIVFFIAICVAIIWSKSICKGIDKKTDDRIKQIAYLYSSSADMPCASKKGVSKPDGKKEAEKSEATASSSRLKGSIKANESTTIMQKSKEVHAIYTYHADKSAGYWICEGCDVENPREQEKCAICGISRWKEGNKDVL